MENYKKRINMSIIFYKITDFLPLELKIVKWHQEILSLQGEDWSFTCKGSWKVIDNEKLLRACYEPQAASFLEKLRNLLIISIAPQSINFPIDPVFGFSNGYKIEIFSTCSKCSWSLQLPSGQIYTSTLCTSASAN